MTGYAADRGIFWPRKSKVIQHAPNRVYVIIYLFICEALSYARCPLMADGRFLEISEGMEARGALPAQNAWLPVAV